MSINDTHLIWIDLEMTGLDTDNDHIIEVATIVTDSELNILEEGPVIAVHQPTSILQKMDAWNTTHHTASGLVDRVKSSDYTAEDAQRITLDFLKQYVPEKKSPMCGNTICQDRRFLHREMPLLEQYFHYRHLDVTTIKILAEMWAPHISKQHVKKTKHLALQDIRDSIDELRYYREHFFIRELHS